MTNPYSTTFDDANPGHRWVAQWRSDRYRWRTMARRYARAHGEAKVWRADGSVVRYWHDAETGTIRQRTYRHIVYRDTREETARGTTHPDGPDSL